MKLTLNFLPSESDIVILTWTEEIPRDGEQARALEQALQAIRGVENVVMHRYAATVGFALHVVPPEEIAEALMNGLLPFGHELCE